ncbi:MAG TPA: c-type cytochrome [Vicinamibacteria bacterium]
MRRARTCSRVAAALVMIGAGSLAVCEDNQPKVITGYATYMTYCAVCHGVAAKGDGPLADSLRVRPPDLTLLAKRSGGRFDEETVRRIIDGRKPVKGHGGPDMPVWGDVFKNTADRYSDAAVREKVMGVVEHLRSIQAPAR